MADLVGADPGGVVFTASATEAANLVLSPAWRIGVQPAPHRLLAGSTEHVCVLQGHRFDGATQLAVDAHGVIDMTGLDAALAAGPGRAAFALQAANNETGVLQPVRAAAERVHAAGGILICDAVQAAGRVPLALADIGADALFVSSHKIGGPKGAGALVLANPDAHFDAALLRGGGQERGNESRYGGRRGYRRLRRSL